MKRGFPPRSINWDARPRGIFNPIEFELRHRRAIDPSAEMLSKDTATPDRRPQLPPIRRCVGPPVGEAAITLCTLGYVGRRV
jgi:hypothetical protein